MSFHGNEIIDIVIEFVSIQQLIFEKRAEQNI